MVSIDSHRRPALCTIASRTGWTAVGEPLMTRRISLVAVCCSSDSVRSAFLVWSSPRSRTFSIAITAWSANARRRSICCSENGFAVPPNTTIAPNTWPFFSIGTASMLRNPPAAADCPNA